jgi:hypothetical protein
LQEKEPMGTAGPLALAKELLDDGSGQPFFVLNRCEQQRATRHNDAKRVACSEIATAACWVTCQTLQMPLFAWGVGCLELLPLLMWGRIVTIAFATARRLAATLCPPMLALC